VLRGPAQVVWPCRRPHVMRHGRNSIKHTVAYFSRWATTCAGSRTILLVGLSLAVVGLSRAPTEDCTTREIPRGTR